MYYNINSIARRKKTRFAVVRGYRSKRRVLNLSTMAVDDYYYLLFVLSIPHPPKSKTTVSREKP